MAGFLIDEIHNPTGVNEPEDLLWRSEHIHQSQYLLQLNFCGTRPERRVEVFR
ncbi:unnamed protein product, partial [Rotaria socialis]